MVSPEKLNERLNEQEISLLLNVSDFNRHNMRLLVSSVRGKDEAGERDLLIVTGVDAYQCEHRTTGGLGSRYRVDGVRWNMTEEQAIPYFHAVASVEAGRMRRELQAIKWLMILALAGVVVGLFV